MSTSNQQQQHLQRGDRRQPFGFLHANILSSVKATDSVAFSGKSTRDDAATAVHSFDLVKNESKKKFRGVLTCIASRRIKGRNNDRSSQYDGVLMESPVKKTSVVTEEELKTCADAAATPDVEVLPREHTEADNLCQNGFAASDVAAIFRQGGFWDDVMKDMLTLKQANPILDDTMCDEGYTNEEERIGPSKSLARELDEKKSVEPILSHNRLKHSEDGFAIHTDNSR